MAHITIYMKDDTVRKFPHEGRLGGSYTKRIRYVADFAIVTDEWGRETAIPSQDIKEIQVSPHRRSRF